jgi:Tfp pilus assembly protein PilX
MTSRKETCGEMKMRRLNLSGERGMALLMAIGIMVVLSIVGTTLVYYSASNLHSTSHSTGSQRAFSLAESGVSSAAAILSTAGNDPTSPTLLPSSSSPAATTVADGTISYWGSYNASSLVWTVTGKGTIRNPNQASPIVRIITQQYSVNSVPSWKYIYMDNPNGCLYLSNTVQITQPLFTRGSLCIDNSSQVTSTASPVTVAGTIQTNNTASVGTSGSHLAVLHIGGGCRYGTSGSFVTPCTATQHVYADSQDATIDATITKAPLNLSQWYTDAKPGPSHNCTTGSFPGGFVNDTTLNHSRSAVDLLPGSGYDCTFASGGTTLGRIAWTPGNPGTLIVQGVIFFDGDIDLTGSAKAVYTGRAAIYSSGTVTFGNSTQLCGLYLSGQCDWTNWNPDTTLLVLVAGSTSATPDFVISQSAMFQGGAYAATDYTSGNTAKQQGPIQATNISLSNPSQTGYPGQASVPYGAPGGTVIAPVAGGWTG